MSESDERPVYMLVVGEIRDREKMGEYQKALMASGLYPENGGYYLATGKPVEMFEGDWPQNRGMVIAKFPSLDHARSFWNSETYQKRIKPLREGAGSFNVSVFPALADE
ncbi:MAG: DUF1330 domain-containing protein [Woeseiaceae bacterium]|nr:DUF1330 domain-containing protein [Woeseiaceae bacterium]